MDRKIDGYTIFIGLMLGLISFILVVGLYSSYPRSIQVVQPTPTPYYQAITTET